MAFIDKAGAGVALAAALLFCTSASATTATQKCQEQKLKAQGKLQLCLQKNSAKVLGGKPDASAACQAKFSAALTKADTKAGTPCPYLDNGDGTVSALNTGLQWEQKDNLDGVINDADLHDADNTYTWADAMSEWLSLVNGYSADGTTQAGLGGHSDWRMPTNAELHELTAPFGPTVASDYWSSTTVTGLPTYAWSVNFYNGGVDGIPKTVTVYVRAVRGGL